MSDDKRENIDEAEAVDATTAAPGSGAAAGADATGKDENKLSGLMSDPAAPAKPAVDLEKEALRAAEQALAEGERALAAAREQLEPRSGTQPAQAQQQPAAPRRGRELALRMLLAVNVLAMVVVALLPSRQPVQQTTSPTPPAPSVDTTGQVEPDPAERMKQPWNRALVASEKGDFRAATAILEAYLQDRPAMPPGERLSVLVALTSYAGRSNDFKKQREYARQAQALEQSHSLPDDLVSMAEAAMASGDQESLRRIWARFLLQQRQIPSWLYQHVARAYLQLGDSYRMAADEAQRQADREEVEAAAARLRVEAGRTPR